MKSLNHAESVGARVYGLTTQYPLPQIVTKYQLVPTQCQKWTPFHIQSWVSFLKVRFLGLKHRFKLTPQQAF